jgi:hypothetical protein
LPLLRSWTGLFHDIDQAFGEEIPERAVRSESNGRGAVTDMRARSKRPDADVGGTAFVGVVVSESVASNQGIGNMMMIASSNFDIPLTFAGLFVLAAMGVAFYAVFAFLEGRITGWAHRGSQA